MITKSQKTMVWILGCLLCTLVVGVRLGFSFAGGSGFVRQVLATNVFGKEIQRGETIATTDAFERLFIGSAVKVSLDRNTTLVVNLLDPAHIELTLTRGRIVIETSNEAPNVFVRTRLTSSRIRSESVASIVDYDFQNQVGVIPLLGHITVNTPASSTLVPLPVVIFEATNPVEIHPTPFHPYAESVREFYTWTQVMQ